MNDTGLHWWSINIGSGNGLVPSGNKPLPEPMLTQISVVIWWLVSPQDSNENHPNFISTILDKWEFEYLFLNQIEQWKIMAGLFCIIPLNILYLWTLSQKKKIPWYLPNILLKIMFSYLFSAKDILTKCTISLWGQSSRVTQSLTIFHFHFHFHYMLLWKFQHHIWDCWTEVTLLSTQIICVLHSKHFLKRQLPLAFWEQQYIIPWPA